MELILGINQKIDKAKLPSADGTAFDSHLNEHDARCFPNTRTDLLRAIAEWAADSEGKCIFWLNDMAGTGKSTISRTVAKSFADNGQLGASFFFKGGEGDRGNAARFFSAIAADLAKLPILSSCIGNAIDADHKIHEKALKEQFEKLILKPLSKLQSESSRALRLFIVVDALDECDREEDIKTIVLLLSQLRDLTSVIIRVLVTSRPELLLQRGFKKISGDTYQNVALQEISQATIEHDMSVFLEYAFTKIRDDQSLPANWPGEENIQALVKMVDPFFILAATVCRFIGDPLWDPKKRLATILNSATQSEASKLDKTYLPILNQMLTGKDEEEKRKLAVEFQEVVGVIIILASPLSAVSLSDLLSITEDDIVCRLKPLHSVLKVPTDQATPVRFFHLSFRDFLLDPLKREKSPFWVDERKTHNSIASKCLQLMSKRLKNDICNLQRPGALQNEINSQTIDFCLPAEVQYACRYWVYHLEQSKGCILDDEQVHAFLQEHFLQWLEAMSLIGNVSQGITMIITIVSILDADKSPNLYEFVYDAKRFALYNRSVIEQAPLQIYSSALIFAPETSIVRRRFEKCIPPWIQMEPRVQEYWDATLQTFEGYPNTVNSVAFSHDSKLLASTSRDQKVLVWDAATGALKLTLTGHTDWVSSIAFSYDSKLLASASEDDTVRVWDVATGALQHMLKGHTDCVNSVAFSYDSELLASASDDQTVRVWDVATGALKLTLTGHTDCVSVVVFSHDSKLLASASIDEQLWVWDTTMGGAPQQTIKSNCYIKKLSFDCTDSILVTDVTSFEVNRAMFPPSNVSQQDSGKGNWQTLNIMDSLVTWNSRNLLWLPLDYRPAEFEISPSGSAIGIGCESGNIIIIGFSLTILGDDDLNYKFS